MPMATAPANPTPAVMTRKRVGRVVPSGRPRNSSRQWAATPTAKKKARTVAPRVLQLTVGPMSEAITT